MEFPLLNDLTSPSINQIVTVKTFYCIASAIHGFFFFLTSAFNSYLNWSFLLLVILETVALNN